MKRICRSSSADSRALPDRFHLGSAILARPRLKSFLRLTFATVAIVLMTGAAKSEVIFEDDFENGFSPSWVVDHDPAQPNNSQWGANSFKHNSGNWSAFCADNGDDQRATYDNITYTWMQLGPLSLVGYSAASIDFHLWMNTELDYDFFLVFVRDQSEEWHQVYSQSGRDDTWRLVSVDLSQFVDQTGLWINFEFFSDSTLVPPGAAGVWIDDVVLTGIPNVMASDLELANLDVGPSVIVEGDKFDYCTYEIINHGPLPLATEAIAIDFYVSRNRIYGDADDARIGGIQGVGSFPVGITTYWQLSSVGLTGMVGDWPQDLPEDDYYLIAVLSTSNVLITDSDTTNNVTISDATIFVSVPLAANYGGAAMDTVRSPGGGTLTVTYAAGSRGVTGKCYVRQGGALNFIPVAMTSGGNGSLTYAIRPADLTWRGFEYYFEIVSADESARIPGSNGFFVMRVESSDAIVATTVDRQYKMIGFPFEPKPASVVQVFDEITDRSATGWRFGHWDPGTESYMAYPDLTTVSRNLGYWLITSGGKTIRASGISSVPDDVFGPARYAQITVEPGWNQIANPFAFNVSAAAIELGGGVEGTFYEYRSDGSGSGYQTATALKPLSGYWIYNGGSRSYIRVPYAEAGTLTATADPSPAPGDWSLRFLAQAGEREDRLNVIGTHRAAADGYDGMDHHEPPGFADYLSMSFLQTRQSGQVDLLSSDFRPSGRSGYAFDVLIRCSSGEPVRLAVEQESELPPDFRAVLVDSRTSATYELLHSPAIILPDQDAEAGSRYKLLVGSEEYLAANSISASPVPRRFTLAQNYPNPFNAGTVIAYELPQVSDVRLEVYDLLGRRVMELLEQSQAAGRHQVIWDGRNEDGEILASGVYVYRVQAGGNVLSRKMVLLK